MVVAPCGISDAGAQNYPVKPIRFYTPYTAGGTTDILARLIGQKIYEDWRQPVIVESKLGAGGNVGTDFVAKAPADGYSLLMGASGPLSINVTLFSKLPYDPVRDFSPLILVAAVPMVLVVHPSVPAKTTRELIALLKSHPGQFDYASGGPGSPQHLTAEMLKFMVKVNIGHIPYKGSGPAIGDLIGGRVPMSFQSMIAIIPHIKSGRLRALAVTSSKRSPLLPGVPTMAQSGVPGFEAIAWYGVLAPAGVPRDIILRLNGEMLNVLKLPDMRERLTEMGSDFVAGTPEEFGDLIKTEIVKWGKIVRESGARAD